MVPTNMSAMPWISPRASRVRVTMRSLVWTAATPDAAGVLEIASTRLVELGRRLVGGAYRFRGGTRAGALGLRVEDHAQNGT